MVRTMRGGNRLFGSETALVYSLLSSGFWKPPKAHTKHTCIHIHLTREHTTSVQSLIYKHTHTCAQTRTRYSVWVNVFGAKKRPSCFSFSVSPLFWALSLFVCHFLSFFSSPSLSLAELQREKVHQGKREERREKRLLDLGRRAARGGAMVSITVIWLFGNRDTSISNKTAKPRQIALTLG